MGVVGDVVIGIVVCMGAGIDSGNGVGIGMCISMSVVLKLFFISSSPIFKCN